MEKKAVLRIEKGRDSIWFETAQKYLQKRNAAE